MKPGKGYLANHCSNLEYRGTFMVLGQENSGASVIAPGHLVCPRRCFHSLVADRAPKGLWLWEVALWSAPLYR